MLLDIALDGYLRLRVDRMEKSSMSGDDLISVVSLVLRSFLCTVPNQDFQQVGGRSTWCSCPKGNQGAVRTVGAPLLFRLPFSYSSPSSCSAGSSIRPDLGRASALAACIVVPGKRLWGMLGTHVRMTAHGGTRPEPPLCIGCMAFG